MERVNVSQSCYCLAGVRCQKSSQIYWQTAQQGFNANQCPTHVQLNVNKWDLTYWLICSHHICINMGGCYSYIILISQTQDLLLSQQAYWGGGWGYSCSSHYYAPEENVISIHWMRPSGRLNLGRNLTLISGVKMWQNGHTNWAALVPSVKAIAAKERTLTLMLALKSGKITLLTELHQLIL